MAISKESLFTLLPINFKEEKLKLQSENKSVNISDYVEKYNPLIFCRTCANMNSCLVPIFREEGLEYGLNTKIQKYLPIQISQNDNLPVHLCYHCASTLIAWDTLFIGCIEAEKKLNFLQNSLKSKEECNEKKTESLSEKTNDMNAKIIIKKASPKMDKYDEKDLILERSNFDALPEQVILESESEGNSIRSQQISKNFNGDLTIINDIIVAPSENTEEISIIPKSWLNIISCKYCGKISCAPKHLRQHERRRTCTKNFQCSDCGQLFAKEINLMKHIKCHLKEKSGDKINRFTCSVCNKKFKFEDNGLAHERICGKRESTHKCSMCGKRFESKALADQHWTCHHRSCVCHMCGQSFSKPESLKQHVRTVHEEVKMVCHYCGKEFSRKARLQEHLQHHTGQMDFTCHVCGKGSTNAYSFGVHLATHSQETPYSCSFCPRTFKHMKYVYLHERSVHLKLKSGKTYVKPKKPGKNTAQRTCSVCNKTFKRESAMLIHKRSVHEGKNGYICKLCGKDFKYTYLLYVHKKKHHFPELCKYICEFCRKPFPVKTELQNHLRKHTGEKPYVCGLCGKTYSFHGSLNMHMKTQHENKKNFKCDICGSSYNFQSHLTRHMNAHVHRYPVEKEPNNSH